MNEVTMVEKIPNWIKILGGILTTLILVILGVVGWLAKNQYEMHGELCSLGTQVRNTDRRVDDIAEVLRGFGVGLAAEEVSKGIQTAVVTTKPFQGPDRQWAVLVHVIDSEKPKKTTFTASLSDQKDSKVAYSVLGVACDLEPQFRSARRLLEWSSEIKQPQSLPGFVDTRATLVFRNTKADLMKERLGWLGPSNESPFNEPPGDWRVLVKRINENPEEFRAGN